MKDTRKQEDIALFRFGVIAPLIQRGYCRSEKKQIMKQICSQEWLEPSGKRRKIPLGTIRDWLRKYRNEGFEGLYPRKRSDRGKSRRLSPTQVETIVRYRKTFPTLTVVHLYEQMVLENILTPNEVSIPTLNRLFRAHGVTRAELRKQENNRDFKPFQFKHRNDCWQLDVMHGPKVQVGNRMARSYLIGSIDDATRIIPAANFYLNEKTESLAATFCSGVEKRGIPTLCYLDNGKVFRSRALKLACAKLGVELVHSKPYKPEGRGKIERFFRTVRENFLIRFQTRKKKFTLAELNAAFDEWVDTVYHSRRHKGIELKTPIEAWVSDEKVIRTVSPAINLRELFLSAANRTVTRDCTVYFKNIRYEVPQKFRGKRIVLRYRPGKPEEAFIHDEDEGLKKLRIVDIHLNRRIKRKGNEK